MDQERRENKRVVENSSQGTGIATEGSSNSVNGVVLHTLIVTNSVATSSVSRDNVDLGSKIDEVGSSKPLLEAQEIVVNHETFDGRVIAENSSNLVIVINSEQSTSFTGEKGGLGSKIDEKGSSDAFMEAPDMYDLQRVGERTGQIDQVLETVIVVNSDQKACVSGENKEFEAKSNQLRSSEALVEGLKRKEPKKEKESCAIDIKCGGGEDEKSFKKSGDEERVCRICYLSSDPSLEATETTATTAAIDSSTLDLIHLGCGCKDELGIAHRHCAEAWFKLKGNRLCEICGQTAKNTTGVGDFRFMEEWNEQRFISSTSNGSSERGGCWRGQPFCNFLMACLVIAFVLPWFFRVNMF